MPTGIYDKYQVTKTSDGKPLESGTYFVLKAGDVLAVASLRSYANNCLILLETHKALRASPGRIGILSMREEEHLRRLAEDAMWTADQWEGRNHGTLPD